MGFAPQVGEWEHLAASEEVLFGVGVRDPEVAAPDVVGQALTLGTGEVVDVPAPPGDPLLVRVATTTGDGALVVGGARCPTLILTEDVECSPASLRWEPDSQEWTGLASPSRVGGLMYIQLTADGVLVGAFAPIEWDDPLTVARLDADVWTPLAEVTSPDIGQHLCATEDAVYVLRVDDSGEVAPPAEGFEPEPVSTHALTRVAVADGTTSDIATPDLFPFFGAASSALSCSRAAPVVASTGGYGEPPILPVLADDGWEAVANITDGRAATVSGDVPGSAASGAAAILSTTFSSDASGSAPPDAGVRRVTAIGADGTVTTLREDARETAPLWLGTSDRLLLLGPSTVPSDDPDQPATVETLAIEVLEVAP